MSLMTLRPRFHGCESLEPRRLMAFVAHVNFQPAGAAVPTGYVADTGATFAARGNGFSYGWNATDSNAVDRNSALSPDQRYDTFNLMQKGGKKYTWEIAVPNGIYTVHAVAGDPSSTSGTYKINAENVLVVNGTASSANRWVEGTASVTVTDGRLTLSNASGSSNNRIDYVDVTQTAPSVTIAASDASASEPGADTATFVVARTGPTNAALTVNYTIAGTATNGADYNTLSGSVTLAAGATSANIVVTPTDDSIFEADETVALTLSAGSNYLLGATTSTNVTIHDDESALSQGLIAYYKFDEGNGATATDLSGNGNNATLVNGPSWTSGSNGGAIDLDGTDDYATAPDSASLNPTAGITISTWIRSDGWTGGNRRIVQKGNDNQFRLSEFDKVLKFSLTGINLCFTTLPSEGVWHHVAATYDGMMMGLYVDGVLASSAPGGVPLATTTDPLMIGAKTAASPASEHYNGAIDEVRLYNRGLTALEVQQLFQSTALPFVTVTASDPSASETPGDGGAFTIKRTGSTTSALTISAFTGGTALSGTDYSPLPTSITIPAGASSVVVPVNPSNDQSAEDFETVWLSLAEGSGYVLGTVNPPVVTITDNDSSGGPLAYYDFDAGTGSSAADLSGFGNTATLNNGAAWSDGISGGAISFDGSNDYLTAPNSASLNPTAAITVSVWINTNSWANGNHRILQKGATDNQYRLTAEFGVLKFHLAGVNNGIITAALPTTQAWHHVVGTYDGTSIKIYVDSVMVAQQAATGAMSTTTDAFFIGDKSSTSPAGDVFNGAIDEVRLYSRALSAIEVQNLYQAFALPVITLTPSDSIAGEPSNNGAYTFTRTGNTNAPLKVGYAVNGTATSGIDYTDVSGNIIIPAGSTTAVLPISVIDDAISEPTETILVDLARTSRYVLGSLGQFTVTIDDNDGAATASPVARYTFDEGAGSTAADSSGNGNNATLANGATWGPGLSVNAMQLDGNDDYASAPNKAILNPTAAISIVAWINADTWANGNHRIVQKGLNDNQYRLTAEFGVLKFHLFGVAGGTVTAPLPTTLAWHQIAGTYDGVTIRLYVDGVVVNQAAASGAIATTSDPLYIGTKSNTPPAGDHFVGKIDDLRIYGQGLTAADVLAMYNAVVLPTVTVVASDQTGTEGADGAAFTVARTGDLTDPMVVNYTVGGTAASGSDYTALTGSVTIPAGAASAPIPIAITNDPNAEPSETIIVTLSPSATYTVGKPSHDTVVINDNDAANHSPNLPIIDEPLADGELVSGFDVHMEAKPFTDIDAGQILASSDFEIWTAGASPVRAWAADGLAGSAGTHFHFGDGTFEGPQAGKNKLEPDTDYQLRIRFHDNSGDALTNASPWATRDFHTLPEQTPTAPGWVAQQAGYRIEEVPFTFPTGELDWRLPTNIVFVPPSIHGAHPDDPLFYVVELYGTIRVVTNNYTVHTYADNLLNYNPLGPISGAGENGLADVAIDPTNGDLYATMLYDDPNDATSNTFPKITKFTSTDGGITAATQTDILKMPGETMHQSHIISNITFGPDGKLYVHVGDGFDTTQGQNDLTFRGKILRLNKDGSAPTDNPHYNPVDRNNDGLPDAEDYWYAKGLRNPFGGAWRDADASVGRPAQHFTVENGPSRDRFSMLVRDRNYLYDGSDASMNNYNIAYSPTGTFENGADDWNPSPAPVNITFVQASNFNNSGFPSDKWGHAFVAMSGPTHAGGPNTAKSIQEWILNDDGTRRVSGPGEAPNPRELVSYEGAGFATAVGVAAGPDGIYFSTLYPDTDPIGTNRGAKIFRIVWTGGSGSSSSLATGGTTTLDAHETSTTQNSVTTETTTTGTHATTLDSNAPEHEHRHAEHEHRASKKATPCDFTKLFSDSPIATSSDSEWKRIEGAGSDLFH